MTLRCPLDGTELTTILRRYTEPVDGVYTEHVEALCDERGCEMAGVQFAQHMVSSPIALLEAVGGS